MSNCTDEVFSQEAGIVCSKTIEIVKLQIIIKELGEILIDAATKTHKSKKLYDWYVKHGDAGND